METYGYVYKAGESFSAEPEEPVLGSIFQQYERVLVESLVTSFGLDILIRDQYGGDVDTIHNVRKIDSDEQMTYKNVLNDVAYRQRGEYSSHEYHSDPRYIAKNREIHELRKAGELKDAYTQERIASNGRSDQDHVISAHEIHEDRGRVLAGLKGTDLANSEENLKPTNPHTNRTKKAMSMDTFLDKYGEEYTDTQKENMRSIDAAARKSYEAKLAKAYYTSPRFAKDLTLAAGNVGIRMGVRQALGFVFAEMWFAVKEEFIGGGDKQFDFGDFLNRLGQGIQRGFDNAKRKYPELFSKFLSGAAAGVLSSLTTTLCNIFFTTAKNVVRIIRQSYASIVEACKVLFINPQNYLFGDRMRAVAKILATGASVVVGVLIGDAVSHIPLGMLPGVGDIVQTFCGTFATGIMSCSLLYFLDRSELVNKLVVALNNLHTIETEVNYYRNQADYFEKYAAELMQIDLNTFEKETEIYNFISEQVSTIKTDAELNRVLIGAYESRGLSLPWKGYNSFDDAMRDPGMHLVFE